MVTTGSNRIVVGYDDSEGSRRAAEWAAAVGRHNGADVLLLGASMPGTGDHLRLDRAMRAERWRLDPADGPGSAPVTTAVTDVAGGDPREVLTGSPHTHGASLIVTGRAGHGSGPGLFHVGSVAEYLAHHTTVPLVVVPDDAEVTFVRIVVGVDGSPASRAAVAWCADLAAATGAAVTAVNVHEPFFEWSPEPDPEGWRRDAERRIRDELAPELVDAGIDLTTVTRRGERPTDGILKAAHGADLLVIGLGPLGPLGVRAGGTAFRTLHGARCPIALIPVPTR